MNVSLVPTTRGDRTDEERGQVDGVAQDVARHAVAALGLQEAPGQQAHRVAPVHREEAAPVVRELTQAIGLQQLTEVQHERSPAVVVAHAGDDPGLPRRRRDAHRLLRRAADGLLAEHVLARFGGRHAQLLVEHVGRGDDDDVDLVVVDDTPPVVGRPFEPEGARLVPAGRHVVGAQRPGGAGSTRSGNSDGRRRNERLWAWPIQPSPTTPMPIGRGCCHRARSNTSGLTTWQVAGGSAGQSTPSGVVDGVLVEPQPAGPGGRGDVGRDDHVVTVQQRMIDGQRFGIGDVERRRTDLTGVQRGEQRLLVDEPAPGGVDEDHAGPDAWRRRPRSEQAPGATPSGGHARR